MYVDLKKCLKLNTDANLPRPVSYHDRTGHCLPESKSVIQKQVDKLKIFVDQMDMKINQEKSKVMLFNTSRTYDFMRKITIDGENHLEVVEEMELYSRIIWNGMPTLLICAEMDMADYGCLET